MKTINVKIAVERVMYSDDQSGEDYFRLGIFQQNGDEIVAFVELSDEEFSNLSNVMDLSVGTITVE